MYRKDNNYVAGVKVPKFSIKDVDSKKLKIYENKLNEIKEFCSTAKNSAMSKNDALKTIKNICNRNDESKIWKDILGDAYQG